MRSTTKAAAGPRASGLYLGVVAHRRHRPTTHAFRYRLYHTLVDVDELETLDREVAGFGYGRAALTSFHDRDHFGPADLPVRVKLARWLAGEGATLPDGPVRVLTNLRVLGYVFNPVSWWFCFHPDHTLAFVVAEVHNTFGDAHVYLLDELEAAGDGVVRARADKTFHVSPFLPVDGLSYRFRLRVPTGVAGERVAVAMMVEDEHGPVLEAAQAGERVELTSAALARALVAYPLVTLRTITAIHAQALRLLRRRVPFHRRPSPPPTGFERIERPPSSPSMTSNRS